MNVYECIAIINSELTDEGIEEASQRIQQLITSNQGEIHKVDNWGRRKMAYEINKHTKGNYILYLYSAPSPVNKKLEDLFKVYDPVFKYMIVKLEKKQSAAALKAAEAAEAAKAAKAAEPATVTDAPATETVESAAAEAPEE